MVTGASELEPGTALGGYRIEGVAGRGGMGVVYRARQLRPERVVALKVIGPDLAKDPTFRARFELEANIAASIEHPNVLPIYEFGEENGLLYLTMRWVEGTDMRHLLLRGGALEPVRATRIIEQVADALDAAHASGLVHRDVKPGNILLIERGGREHAFLTDFGLTKRTSGDAGQSLTAAGSWVGTLDYVAPEQIQGQKIDARADVYSLGCVLFQALSGRVPFERDSDVSKIYAHISEPPPDVAQVVSGIPPALSGVVQKAMSKQPDDRYPSAGDFGRAAVAASQQHSLPDVHGSVAVGPAAGDTPTVLQPAVGQTVATPQAATVTPATLQPPGGKRPPVALIVGGVAALVAIAVVAVVIASSSSSSSSGGTNLRTEVEKAAANFMAASGASTCDLVTPAFIARNYKGVADCRKQFSTANSESISGPQAIGVTGTRAMDTFNIASGHHYSLVLVKQNGKWLVDDSSDDTQDAQNGADDYVKARGPAVCQLITERLKAQRFGGANCATANAKYTPAKPTGDQVTATSTRATDDLSVAGKHGTITLVKTNGTWLVDRDTTLK